MQVLDHGGMSADLASIDSRRAEHHGIIDLMVG
jgi:hypothetical protein